MIHIHIFNTTHTSGHEEHHNQFIYLRYVKYSYYKMYFSFYRRPRRSRNVSVDRILEQVALRMKTTLLI